MGKRKGRCTRKNRAAREAPEPQYFTNAPHSFVIHRGIPTKHTLELTRDFRRVMEPYTASQLRERRNNSIKDFVSVSGVLHVSHMCIFSMTKLGLYFKVARLPRGPSLTFKIHNFCFIKDVISSVKKQYFLTKAFHNAPLIVMNSFSGEGMHLKLMANMFQNMFPTINVSNVKLKTIRRCVLLNYNADTKLIDFRHYFIKILPVGLTKGTKKIIQGKVPNLSKCNDIADFFDKTGILSESECEDDVNTHVILPQDLSSRGASKDQQSAVKLFELGPRLTLQLIKVEDGLFDGEVLFHEFILKTDEEKEEIKRNREIKRKLREKRKKVQEENIKQKSVKKEENKQKSLQAIKQKKESENQRLSQDQHTDNISDDEDDAEYYRSEVGKEPEHDLFSIRKTKKRSNDRDGCRIPTKKVRFNHENEERYKKTTHKGKVKKGTHQKFSKRK